MLSSCAGLFLFRLSFWAYHSSGNWVIMSSTFFPPFYFLSSLLVMNVHASEEIGTFLFYFFVLVVVVLLSCVSWRGVPVESFRSVNDLIYSLGVSLDVLEKTNPNLCIWRWVLTSSLFSFVFLTAIDLKDSVAHFQPVCVTIGMCACLSSVTDLLRCGRKIQKIEECDSQGIILEECRQSDVNRRRCQKNFLWQKIWKIATFPVITICCMIQIRPLYIIYQIFYSFFFVFYMIWTDIGCGPWRTDQIEESC